MAKKTKADSGKDSASKKKSAKKKPVKKAAAKKAASRKSAKSSSKASTEEKAARKKAAKKKATKTKAAKTKAAKKKAIKKKPTTKKATEKKAARKKAAKKNTRKQAAAKKTTRKSASGKATSKKAAKKTASRKSASGKATGKKAAKKTASRKTAAKKKPTPKKAARSSGPSTPAERALEAPGRRGQLAAEKARFETGEHAPVLREELGELPPGYDLSIVRAWIRDPRHIAIVWDINDPEMVALAERIGWQAIGVRVLDEAGTILSDLHVEKRSGTFQLELSAPGLSLRMALGVHREDGFFETLALSGPVRTPPEAPAADEGEYHTLRLGEDLDRRLLAEHEPPPLPGHRAPSALSPGARARARLELAYRSVVGTTEDPTLAARLERALASGEASEAERLMRAAGAGSAQGERRELREALKGSPERPSGGAKRAGAGVSSERRAGAPSSHERPTSPSRPTSPGASRR